MGGRGEKGGGSHDLLHSNVYKISASLQRDEHVHNTKWRLEMHVNHQGDESHPS